MSARAAALAGLLALQPLPAWADETRKGQEALRSFEDLTNKAARDAAYVATPFLRPTRAGLALTAAGLMTLTVVSFNDFWLHTNVQKRRNSLHAALDELEERNWIESLGRSGGPMIAAGAFYTAGLRTGERERRVSFLIVESWALNNLATEGLKYSVGRRRPRENEQGHSNPFSKHNSFPSGHASTAFALGTTIALEYDDWRVDAASYGMAAVVAWSRLQRDVHWLSDAVGGAALGILIARTTRSLYFQDNRDWGIIFDGQRVAVEKRF